MKVTVWNEYVHEKNEESIRAIYPEGIHGCIAKFLAEAGYDVTTATLEMPEAGLTDEVLNETDVLFWWGHVAHGDVPDAVGLALGLAFGHWNKNRKAGKICGCDCSSCSGNCHK